MQIPLAYYTTSLQYLFSDILPLDLEPQETSIPKFLDPYSASILRNVIFDSSNTLREKVSAFIIKTGFIHAAKEVGAVVAKDLEIEKECILQTLYALKEITLDTDSNVILSLFNQTLRKEISIIQNQMDATDALITLSSLQCATETDFIIASDVRFFLEVGRICCICRDLITTTNAITNPTFHSESVYGVYIEQNLLNFEPALAKMQHLIKEAADKISHTQDLEPLFDKETLDYSLLRIKSKISTHPNAAVRSTISELVRSISIDNAFICNRSLGKRTLSILTRLQELQSVLGLGQQNFLKWFQKQEDPSLDLEVFSAFLNGSNNNFKTKVTTAAAAKHTSIESFIFENLAKIIQRCKKQKPDQNSLYATNVEVFLSIKDPKKPFSYKSSISSLKTPDIKITDLSSYSETIGMTLAINLTSSCLNQNPSFMFSQKLIDPTFTTNTKLTCQIIQNTIKSEQILLSYICKKNNLIYTGNSSIHTASIYRNIQGTWKAIPLTLSPKASQATITAAPITADDIIIWSSKELETFNEKDILRVIHTGGGFRETLAKELMDAAVSSHPTENDFLVVATQICDL